MRESGEVAELAGGLGESALGGDFGVDVGGGCRFDLDFSLR